MIDLSRSRVRGERRTFEVKIGEQLSFLFRRIFLHFHCIGSRTGVRRKVVGRPRGKREVNARSGRWWLGSTSKHRP